MEATDKYFQEYEDLAIHELMLKDRPRQEAYYNAIMKNAHMFKDKVVLDVGAGTGILSLFCAKAGARLVYAVEATNLATIALDIVKDNELTSIVKVVQSKIEDFELPSNVGKVDIIVSEWMGFYLLHEGMLDSVLFARDKFLKSDGHLFPSEATIYVAPCSIFARFDLWQSIDGICMNTFAAHLRKQKCHQPEIELLPPTELLHEGVAMHWLNLQDVQVADLQEIKFRAVVAAQKAGKHQGFCIWFDVRFPSEHYEDAVVLSTAPNAPATHWKQCIVVLPENLCDNIEAQTPIAFEICLKRKAQNARQYNVEVEMLDASAEEHTLPCDCHMTKCILTKAHLNSMDTAE